VKPLLVRDAVTIGVPVCREAEACGQVAARLKESVVVVLNENGIACGWTTAPRLWVNETLAVAEVMDEEIPTVPPDIPLEAAAQMMRDRGVEFLFLMHDWPGEARPAAMISLRAIEQALADASESSRR
jgi:CBS domain-containing protein